MSINIDKTEDALDLDLSKVQCSKFKTKLKGPEFFCVVCVLRRKLFIEISKKDHLG